MQVYNRPTMQTLSHMPSRLLITHAHLFTSEAADLDTQPAYAVGMLLTLLALALMKQAQPALLYLVPTTLGSVTLTALIRREFVLFFTGKTMVSVS